MKVIKNEEDYDKAIHRVEELLDTNPAANCDLGDELDVLSLLIEKYEDEHYPISMPDPIEAIKFRMEQQGLKYTDMIEYFGSRSKVSEVLNYKRKLSLNMIRRLHDGLEIPADVLISDSNKTLPDEIPGIKWNLFPIGEMLKREWIIFEGSLQKAKENAEELIRDFFKKASFSPASGIYFRKSIRSNSSMDEYALAIWHAKVLIEENSVIIKQKYNDSLTDAFMQDLKKLSLFDEGPLLAQEILARIGIKLIVVSHLPKTHIDGATFYNNSGDPVVALTLRYDRIDYFWFTLFHELAHIKLHLSKEHECFIDDLSNKDIDEREEEADLFAENKLIDPLQWDEFYSGFTGENDIANFSTVYGISEAILAGRIQKESNDFRMYKNLLGQGKVKKLFMKENEVK